MNDIIFFEELESTNTYLRSLAMQGAEAGTVIAARRQTGGKGRMGRSFASPEGGLYFSMLLRPENRGRELLLITPMAAVAVHDTIKELCGVECGIKWPNDLVVNAKKLCGILTEAVTVGNKVSVILGIGVNLNTPDFGGELENIAVSVKQLTGRDTDIKTFARYLRDALQQTYSEKPDLQRYRELCVNVGRSISFVRDGAEKSGVCVEVNEDFSLRVEHPDGSEENLFFGEVL